MNDQCRTYVSVTGELDVQLFERSADCIKIIDLDGSIQRVNPGAAQALELDDLSVLHETRWEALWPEASRELVVQAVAAGARGERSQFVAFCPTARGTPRWWDVIVSPIVDAQGAVRELMAISRDVTELYTAREALREAARQKDAFLLLLAHELRNPLSAANMAATMLDTLNVADPRVGQLAQVVTRQISHMSTLVEGLIDIDRATRGEVTLKLAAVDMRVLVREALEQVEPLIRAKRHTLELDLGKAASLVCGDRVRLVQSIGNLLGNAARYTREQGRIQVTVQGGADAVRVTVTDNGIGIAEENLAGIFERYSQVDPSSERKNGGLGLGLSLVRKLAALHHGTITAFSAGRNTGSAFTLTLPALA
jgi:PAS domain S-box-containing protein